MAMVGLFWIGEDSVHVGAEPVGAAPGVRLTEDGVAVLGADGGRFWTWDEVVRIETRDVPVRSAVRRLVSMTFDAALVAVTGDGELPPAFTVEVATAGETVVADTHTAVTGGIYLPSEYDLSTTLLRRLAEGSADIADLLAWGREHASEGTPAREEREALLRKWAGL